ncbi:DUF4245 family protein [Nocardioides panacisoli]|uniref:DUF4245 domain-containing protein n=1 Tax=Nocardioides panacisoli TaxID=627624 RepID=A0ABP7IET6_9ACTN
MSTTEQQPAEPTGRPGKYQRSAGGLIAALVTTAVVIGALIWVMGLFRHDTDIGPDSVDLRTTIAEFQQGGLQPVYPRSVPDGWTVTAAEVPEDQGGFEIRMLTDDGKFVGIAVAKGSSPFELLHHLGEEEATAEAAYSSDGSVAPKWDSYSDGSDHAYVAELSGQRLVVVYGDAPASDLQDIVDRLTTAPVGSKS